MQIYFGYILEICTFTLPILVIQIINNVLLNKWDYKTITTVSGMSISLILQLQGLVTINEMTTLLHQETNKRNFIKQ